MAMTFREWLKQQFNQVVSVQATGLNSQLADLIVQCWSGVRIRVHLIDQPVNPRALRRSLNDATQDGVNAMFLVDAHVLPADGERTRIDNWLLAIQMISDEHLYAYRVSGSTPEVFQVHFEPVVGSDAYYTWYGPYVDFERLRHFRKTIYTRPLKGDWLVADFGMHAFWKNNDYRQKRKSRDQVREQARETFWQTWSTYQTWSGNPYQRSHANTPNDRPIGAHLDACYKMLGVERGASHEEVKAAYRKCARDYHPDTSSLPPEEANARFQALNAAYDYIKSAHGWS